MQTIANPTANSRPHSRGKRAAFKFTVVTSLALFVGGCTMSETQKRTGTGAAIGALGGALLGTSRESAAIGAAVGAAGGYIVDQHKKREDADSENARLRAENERLREQAATQERE